MHTEKHMQIEDKKINHVCIVEDLHPPVFLKGQECWYIDLQGFFSTKILVSCSFTRSISFTFQKIEFNKIYTQNHILQFAQENNFFNCQLIMPSSWDVAFSWHPNHQKAIRSLN